MRKRLTITALAVREAEVLALAVAEPTLTTRQLAERMGYADHSGAARAIRRCLRRLEAATLDSAQKHQARIAARLDDAAEQLEEIADVAKDHGVRVRALSALTANSHELGLVTGAIKLPPPMSVTQNNTQTGWDLSVYTPEELVTLRALAKRQEEKRADTPPPKVTHPSDLRNVCARCGGKGVDPEHAGRCGACDGSGRIEAVPA